MTDQNSSRPSAKQAFSGKVVWITGASSGIGEALAQAFADAGARLVLSARNVAELERVRNTAIDAGANGDNILVLPMDVTDYDALPKAVATVQATYGAIDLLINNAGISQRSLCLDTDMSVYRRLFEVDVMAPIALTRLVLPIMVQQGSGHIAVTASVAGKFGAPLRTGYCAAKHAVMGFFDALRCEVAHLGIRVSTIVPGFIRTNISANALNGQGEATQVMDSDIENGMDTQRCAQIVIDGLAAGTDEISVGDGPEMALLDLKRQDPEQLFRLVEDMAAQQFSNTSA